MPEGDSAAKTEIIAPGRSGVFDRPGITRTLRNKGVQQMWDVVAAHEFPMREAEEAFGISACQRRGKILLSPHGLPNARGGG